MKNFTADKIFVRIRSKRGSVLVSGLLVVLVLTLLSLGTLMRKSAALKISSDGRATKESFYIAQAGIEDARSRLQPIRSHDPISVRVPLNSGWRAFIGTRGKAISNGYQVENSNHALYRRLYSALKYDVTIRPKLDPSGNVLKWGDPDGNGILEENTLAGKPIFVITSEGKTPSGVSNAILVEASQVPPLSVPAALYAQMATTIGGSSTHIQGREDYGSSGLPGVMSRSTITRTGNPHIEGFPPLIENSALILDVQHLINQFKNNANYYYWVYNAEVTGKAWGDAALADMEENAADCTGQPIVYFQTNSTFLSLRGRNSGCGLLLVEGDLHLQGDFQWYGAILATGSIVFSGGGKKNIKGAVLAGGQVSAEMVGGDLRILYSSKAITRATESIPLIIHRRTETFAQLSSRLNRL